MDNIFNQNKDRVIAQATQPKFTDRTLSSTSLTFGDISFAIGLIVAIGGLIAAAVKVSLKFSALKNDLDLINIKLGQKLDVTDTVVKQKLENIDSDVKQKYDALTARLDSGFEHIRAEGMQSRIRINYNSQRIRQVEFYLGKSGYIPRQDNEDSLG